MTTTTRYLIVNADDFGLTHSINRGIIEAHEHGIVTSASLMVRGEAAREAGDYARRNSELSVGLHIDLAEWRYLGGEWTAAYQVVDAANRAAIKRECERQLREFESIVGRAPTHLDSHQHVHLSEPTRSVVTQLAAKLDVPLRSCSPLVTYNGSFYGQTGEGDPYREGISIDSLVRLIENLPTGSTELGCHPGYVDGLDSVYLLEREDEVRALCSDAAREAIRINNVQLGSFATGPIVDAPPRGIEGAPRFRG